MLLRANYLIIDYSIIAVITITAVIAAATRPGLNNTREELVP